MSDILLSLWNDFLFIFDGLCILIAMFLFYKVEEGYRDIAFFVLCFFVVSDAVAHHFFMEFRGANNWFIYQLYNIVIVAIMWKIRNMRSAMLILLVLTANILLNIVVSYYFISNSIAKIVYTIYPYPAGFLMLLCLFYLWMVGYGIRLSDSKINNSAFINSLLRVCLGRYHRLHIKGVKG